MRNGFTTGSCAAAAAKAATLMLFTGTKVSAVNIVTPKGSVFEAKIEDAVVVNGQATCCVVKDGGDDPDITTGAHIFATATIEEKECSRASVRITGGAGVGRVTKPGLDQGVGEYAINSIPRKMIEEAVLDVCDSFDCRSEILITISVPEGEELAKSTFNPRLGIEGGISIIGTSGVVEPMSSRAIVDTIFVELRQRATLGEETVVIVPGNYGQQFIKDNYNYDLDKCVKCSNFIGETVDFVRELGFKKMLLIGHIGKLVKVAGGIMNTHSKESDSRMEILASAALLEGADAEVVRSVLSSLTTQEALDILEKSDKAIFDGVMERIMDKIIFYLNKRAEEKIEIQAVMFSNENGVLAMSKGAKEWLTLLGREAEA